MYGLINQILAVPGQRAALVKVLAAATRGMPGCIAYVIANDTANDAAIWITEIWESKEAHARSLQLRAVQTAMAEGRPLIAGLGARAETMPVAGVGRR
jgi:quinol monooxygenase YgiN